MRRLIPTLVLFTTFLCTFNSAHSQCSTTITQFPYEEGFESNSFGDWTGDIGTSNGFWQISTGPTGSGGTGPVSASEGIFFAYTETSAPGAQLDTYRITSPCFQLPLLSAPNFLFDYHMQSDDAFANMGSFTLLVDSTQQGNWDTLWTKFGDQDSNWLDTIVDLSDYAGSTIQLQFVGIAGNTSQFWQGDRAIDDLVLTLGVETTNPYCQGGSNGTAKGIASFGSDPYSYQWSTGATADSIGGLNAGIYTVTITDNNSVQKVVEFEILDGLVEQVNSIPYYQSWEDSLDGWMNSDQDDFDWTFRANGVNGTGPTVPTAPSDGLLYIYTEATGQSTGDVAILESPCFHLSDSTLPYMVFDYHMKVDGGGGNNANMGDLYLIADTTIFQTGDEDTIWQKIGAQGNFWLTDTVDLSPYVESELTLNFVGIIGTGFAPQYGDRAIDNIRILDAIEVSESCDGASGGSVFVDPIHGVSPYSFLWSTGATTPGISNLGAGTYTVTITDGNSNAITRTVDVDSLVIPTPTGIASNLNEYCENDKDTVTLSIDYIQGDATYFGTSATLNDLGPNNTAGVSVLFNITGAPNTATSDAQIAYYSRGDLEAPGEWINIRSEDDDLLVQSLDHNQQCGATFVVAGFTVNVDTINAWNQNDTLSFEAEPIGTTRYCGTGANRYSHEGFFTIEFEYSTMKPYWFENSCDTVVANAIDSGFFIDVSPSVTTTYYVRYYNAVCDQWGDCDSITITVNPKPIVSVIPDSVSICNNSGQTLTATGASSYAWSPGTGLNSVNSATVFANPSNAQTYTVIGTDTNQCSDTTTAHVSISQNYSVSTSSTSPTCVGGNNGSVTVSVSGSTGPYTYLWSTGSTSTTVTGLSAGTYTVSVTDDNGCETPQSVAVTDPAPFTVTIFEASSISCNGGNNGSLIASVSNATGAPSFSWSTGASGGFIFSLSTGVYSVTATAGGCTAVDTFDLNQPTPLVAQITSGDSVSCFGGNDGQATVTATGGTPGYTYAWTSSETTAAATMLSAGTNTVTVTDVNGCVATADTTISEPSELVASVTFNNDVTCNGGNDGSATASATGGTSGYTYNWDNGEFNALAVSLDAGTHCVTVTDANGCVDTACVSIAEPDTIAPGVTISDVSCNGGSDGSITLSPSGSNGGPFTYQWSNSQNTSSINGLSAGNHTVTITDNSSCDRVFTINIDEPSALSLSASGSNVACNGNSTGTASVVATGGTPNYTYLWSNGSTISSATGLAAGSYTVTVTDQNSCSDTAQVQITEPTPLSIAIDTSVNVSCNGLSDGSAISTIGGGTSPYTVLWSNNATTQNVSNLSAGTYSVTVTDDNNCVDSSSVTITEPAALVASAINLSNVTCYNGNDGSAQASASGGTTPYTYSWSTGSSNQTIMTLSAATYEVTVTDSNGCTDSASVVISEPDSISVSFNITNVSCNNGSNGSVTATASGGDGGPYSYNWSSGSVVSTASGLSAGTYAVTATDNSACSNVFNVSVSEPIALALSTSTSNTLCNGGNSGSASVTASGGTPGYTYLWTNGSTGSSANSLAAGNYTVTVTDNNGCEDSATVTIAEPTAVVAIIDSIQDVTCNGLSDGNAFSSASGGTTPYTFSWSNSANTSTNSGLSAGVYTLIVTDSNGCMDTTTATISQPAVLVASTTVVSNVSCNSGNDGEASASGSGGTMPYTYDWSNGAQTSTSSGLAAGTHTVTITDANGCTDTETVIITEPTPIAITLSVDSNVTCNGLNNGGVSASATGGTGALNYSWSNGGNGTSIDNLFAGTYTVSVTDANNCVQEDSIEVTEPAVLVATFSQVDSISCFGVTDGALTADGIGGTAPFTFLWSTGNTTDSIGGLGDGTYSVTVTDVNGCFDDTSMTFVSPAIVVVSIDSTLDANCFGGSDGQAFASGTGGTTPYNFSWSNGSSGPSPATFSVGNYTMTLTDANGCLDTESFSIGEPASAVSVSAVLDSNVSCNGGANGGATASGSGGTGPYSFLWSNGESAASATALMAGTNTVVITDANGCQDSTTIAITEPSAVVASVNIDSNASCNGSSDGGATASATGGTGAYTYLWSDGQTTATALNLAAGSYGVTITDANGCQDVENITITEPTAVSASVSLDSNVSCNGSSNGGATASATGGTGAYSYLWSDNQTTASAVGLISGTYTVTVSDANGCEDIASITISEPTALIASAAADSNVSCNNGSNGEATASAVGGTGVYTFLWSDGQTSATATGLMAGTYSVTISDAISCVDSASVTITEPTAVVASVTLDSNASCNGFSDGGATASATGGTGAYTYLWSDNQTTASAIGLAAGTHTVTVSDANGCEDIASISITEPATLVASAIVDSNVACNAGSNGQATASATGGTMNYAYLWSDGQTAATATGLMAGTYSVTITDANGCVDSASVTITEPTAVIASVTLDSNASCNGFNDGGAFASATGGTGAYTYLWSDNQTTASAVGLAVGTYTVTVSDANGCEDTASITITEPATLVASAVVDSNVACNAGNNGQATASAVGGTMNYAYLWNDGQTTATATGLMAGTYSVTITDANGCIDSASVTITEPTAVVASVMLDSNASCNGFNNGGATASASGGTGVYSFLWSDNQTTASAVGLSAGIYSVTVSDANGCEDSTSITITEPATLVASAIVDTNVACNAGNNGEATASATGGTGAYSFLWSDNQTTATATSLAAGTYTVTITDINGCEDSASVTITEPTAVVASITLDSNASCNGFNNGGATASATGGTGAYTYLWSDNQTTASAIGLAAGTFTVTVSDANGCEDTASITITEPTTLVASAQVDSNISCNAGNNGQATASATGGTGLYTYLWSDNQTNETATGLMAGTYTVTVTDANGCEDSTSVVISEPSALVVVANLDSNVTCNNGNDGGATALVSGGTSPFNYNWSIGDTTASITNLSSGTYSVTVTDNNGCTDSSSVLISEPVAVSASIQFLENIQCNGDSNGTAAGVGSNGVEPYSYLWTTGDTLDTLIDIPSGNYDLTVTDANGCTANASGILGQPQPVVASISLDSNVSCFNGNDAAATASTSGGWGNYTYLWSNGQTTATASMLSVGTYIVTASDSAGCLDTNSITITEPNELIGTISIDSNVSCNSGSNGGATVSVTGGTGVYTYLWSNGQTSASASGFPAGTHYVLITDANGCEDSTWTTISEPNALVTSVTLDSNVTCNGLSNGGASASATGGTGAYSFLWSDNQTTASAVSLTAGTYTVTVSDANGCEDTASITITEPATLLASAVVDSNVACNAGSNGQATASATGGTMNYSYLWSDNQANATATGLAAGTYSVTITDVNGCTDSTSIVITEPDTIDISASITQINCFSAENGSINLTLTGGTPTYTQLWSTGATAIQINDLDTGTYSVTVTDANGCSNSASYVITQPDTFIAQIVSTDSVFCFGDSTGQIVAGATGGVTPYSYSWPAPINGVNNIGNDVPAGTFVVTVTDDNNCFSTVSATIFEPTDILLDTTIVTQVNCVGGNDGAISVSASGGLGNFSFSWNTGATGSSISGLVAGEYCVTVTDGNGCQDSLCVTITELNQNPIVSLGADTTFCFQNYTLTGGNFNSYNWSTGSTSNSITVSSSGQYAITVSDANGCTDSDTIDVTVNPNPQASVSIVDSANCGVSNGIALASIVNAGGGSPYSYAWSNGQNFGPGITGLPGGMHTVTVSDVNGCKDTVDFMMWEDTIVSAQFTVSNVTCFGAMDGTVIAEGLNGTAPYSYSWSSGQIQDTLTGMSGGTYTVTITDVNGCGTVADTNITEPLEIVLTTSSIEATCGGTNGSAIVAATPGSYSFTYLWSNGQSNDTASNLASGIYTVTVTEQSGCTKTASVNVNNLGAPTLNAGSVDEQCAGLNNGFAFANASGNGPLTYLWNDPNSQTTDTASNLGPGNYSVTVTDANGCSSFTSFTIDPGAANPVVNLGADTAVCANFFVLNAGSGLSNYLWSTGSSNASISVSSSNVYWVNVEDANGCEGSDTIDVTLNPPVAFNTSANPANCNQNNGSASVNVIGGGGNYQYLWSNGGTADVINNVAGGIYGITVTDQNGCEDSDFVTVTLIDAPVLNLSSSDASCNSFSDGAASVSVSNGVTPYSYSWSTGSSNTSVSNLTAGNYTITVTDNSNCAVVETFAINEPPKIVLDINTLASSCGVQDGQASVTASGGAGDFNYLWSNGSDSTVNDNIGAGVYTVTVTDSTGCSNSGLAAINDNGAPLLITSSSPASCSNNTDGEASVNAIGNNPFSYQWNDPQLQQTATAFNLGTGVYAVQVTDTFGCIAASIVNVGFISDAPLLSLGDDIEVCEGEEIILTPGGGYNSYSWNTGGFTPSIAVTQSGTYAVTVSNNSACQNWDTVEVTINAAPVVFLGNDTILCADSDFGSELTLDAGLGFTTYLWNDGTSNQTNTVSATGVYGVTVSDAIGCTGSDQIIVVVDTCINLTADEVIVEAWNVNIFPNPNRGQFTITIDGMQSNETTQMELMNLQGERIWNREFDSMPNQNYREEVTLDDIAAGMYFLRIRNSKKQVDYRVIIQ